ncbi:glycosyltransferase [Spirulina subsalsa]|uniref:glycosyltransferase n=1 Tax=Spirulina subsalsa TaxID=54311 RepID=UPI00030A4613|nr:glycosyltransferase [Spirulina subsalsa]
MTKILHVIPSLSPLRGGPTAVALNLVRALRDRGVEAEITATNDHGPGVLEVPLGERVDYEGVPVWFFPRFSSPFSQVSLGGDRGFLFSLAWTRWLWQNLHHYDVLDLHYLFSYGSSCAGAIARQQKIPYTVRSMGQLAPWALAQSRRKKQMYAQLLERRNLNQAAAVHCTSPGEVEDVRNFGITAPTLTLPLGVESPPLWPDAPEKLRQTYNIPPETPIILFLSRLHYKKRPELLLEALHHLAPRPPFHLLLAGSGDEDYVNQIKQQVRDLQLQDCTTFTGFVTGEAKQLLLQGSDLFVLPSFSENFGIAVAEAMAHGLPVIVTPEVQIAPDIIQGNTGRVVSGAVEPWASAIAELLASPTLRQTLGANGRHLGQSRYSWQAIAESLLTAYHAIIQHQPLPQP